MRGSFSIVFTKIFFSLNKSDTRIAPQVLKLLKISLAFGKKHKD
jgi:hypothetical protein